MTKKEITVIFRTITPLWTGDAWQDNLKIRPSSLMGSLRFWFETIMYFADILKKKDFDSKSGRFEKEVNRKKLKEFIQENGNDINKIIKYLIKEQKIPISSVIFGTTNWRSLIEIKDILDINPYKNYKYYIGKMFFPELKHNDKIPTWYFNKGFYGKFKIKFFIEESILNSIFYPLLTFMDKYGFWGGKWNIGYGRLKIENINGEKENWKKEEFDLQRENFSKSISFSENGNSNNLSVLKTVNNFNDLTNHTDKKIKLLKNQPNNNDLKDIIKELIKIKAQERAKFRNNTKLRHKIFGKTGNPKYLPYVPQGSKILPFIYEESNQLKGGFLSIVGVLTLENNNQ